MELEVVTTMDGDEARKFGEHKPTITFVNCDFACDPEQVITGYLNGVAITECRVTVSDTTNLDRVFIGPTDADDPRWRDDMSKLGGLNGPA